MGHSNLISGTSIWDNKEENCRQFDTVEEHNKVLVDNINSVVGENDILYHLGDWSFGGIDNIWNFRKQLNCKDIRLLLGNHDHLTKNNKVLPNCVRLESGEIVDKDSVKLWTPTTEVKAQELFTSVDNYLEVTIEKQKLILCHFPLQAWNYAEKGSYMVHGHCHHKFDGDYNHNTFKIMDAGMDWEEFRPYSFDEIMGIMSTRINLKRHSNL